MTQDINKDCGIDPARTVHVAEDNAACPNCARLLEQAAQICDAPHFKVVVRTEMKRRAAQIRALPISESENHGRA